MTKPSLAICTCSSRQPVWPYAFALARLMATGLKSFDRATLQLELGYATDMARNRLVSYAKRDGFSHILFLDDDMSFPQDTAERLIAHGKPIVAANYTSRVIPVVPLSGRSGKRIPSKGRSGLETVDFAPTGIMLIDLSVFDKLDLPYFRTTFIPETPFDFMSDDVYFCNKAREKGYDIWIDHDLSQQIGHIGSIEFHHGLTPNIPSENDGKTDIVEMVKEFVA